MVTCYLTPKNFDANAIPNSILRYDGKEDKNDRSDSKRQRTEGTEGRTLYLANPELPDGSDPPPPLQLFSTISQICLQHLPYPMGGEVEKKGPRRGGGILYN